MSSPWSVTVAGDRAEVLALCVALELYPDASYEQPAQRHGQRTPDWLLRLPDGRSVAMEVTSKTDDLRYKDLDVDGVTVRAGFNVKSWGDGDTDDLYRTLTRKMQDKAIDTSVSQPLAPAPGNSSPKTSDSTACRGCPPPWPRNRRCSQRPRPALHCSLGPSPTPQTRDAFRIPNDFNFFCLGRSVGSSPEPLTPTRP